MDTKTHSNSKKIKDRRNGQAGVSNSKLSLNSFFAGIGGFDLGFQRAGIRPIFHCEINKFCISVLKRHWPKIPCEPDILKLLTSDIPNADVWCGGFPCQDVSVARGWLGRDGLKGQNTGFFFPFAALVKQRLPEVVLMENVTGLLNSHGGRDFAVVLQTFHELGYGVAWRVLNARYFGAPQSRPRVYICAWLRSPVHAFNVLFENGPTFRPESQRLGFLKPTICPHTGARVPEIAFCLAATSGRHTGTDWSRSYISYQNAVRRLTPTECEGLQGFPTNWTLPHEDYHQNDEDIDTLRYHAIGNAVSVPVVEWVAGRIRAEIKNRDANTVAPTTHWDALREIVHRVPDFALKKAVHEKVSNFATRDDAPAIKWNSGGVMAFGNSLMAPVSAAPNKPISSRFVDILEAFKPNECYFLSPNAATGILRRVKSQERVLFQPLDAALRRLAEKEVSKAVV